MFEIKQFEGVRTIFGDLEAFQPMCTAVLEGIWPGRVWVDDAENPKTGLLITFLSAGGAAWCFLAGEPDNPRFNHALNKAIFEEKIAGLEVGTFLFTCQPPDWSGQLSMIGQPREPAGMPRRHYTCQGLSYDWRGNLAAGCAIQAMDSSLLSRDELKIPGPVKTTLEKWDSITDKRFKDYGYVAICEGQIAAWATVDFVAAGKGDLGFETLMEYRQRGLGSAVAAAAIDHGLTNGIEVHWTCAEDNIGSRRTAEKLGLMRGRDYFMYMFSFDLLNHTAQLAYSKLLGGAYQEAIDLYEGLFEQKTNLPAWAYFDTAQACAALSQVDKAIKYLRMAVKGGLSDAVMTENTEEFKSLKDHPEWEAVLESMRQPHKDE